MKKILSIIFIFMFIFSVQMSVEGKGDNMQVREIILGGGCFWGMEGYFGGLRGVIETEVGYANGLSAEASYENLKKSDHVEVVRIRYDAHVLSLEEILGRFFKVIDPTRSDGQGNDIGRQYRVGVYYVDEISGQRAAAYVDSRRKDYAKPVVVEVEGLVNYVRAESYHQKYLVKNPDGYCHINIKDSKKPLFYTKAKAKEDEGALRERIGDLAYEVTQKAATEKAFSSALVKEKRKGLYVDVVTGEALFLSSDKFDSGCGWPSFSKSVLSDAVVFKADDSHGMQRTEVLSASGKSHLGHVFDDGPKEKGGLRYCINGAALRFIPYEDLEAQGYEAFKTYF